MHFRAPHVILFLISFQSMPPGHMFIEFSAARGAKDSMSSLVEAPPLTAWSCIDVTDRRNLRARFC